MSLTQKMQDNDKKFSCKTCNFKTDNKYNFQKHLMTSKHKKMQKMQKTQEYICLNCKKEYKTRTGLWFHKKKCFESNEDKYEDEDEDKDENEDEDKEAEIKELEKLEKHEFVLYLIKENQEFKKMLIEQQNTILDSQNNILESNKQNQELMMEIVKKPNYNTTNNNNCNSFNINLFLNENCKDAMNFMEFVDTISLSIDDLEKTSELGYIKGISNIIINGLNELDVTKRPIHCSDFKRETIYIKDNDVWEKESEEKTKVKNMVRFISRRNAKQVGKWTETHEGYMDYYNKNNDKYMKIVYEANGGDDHELNKIIKNVSSHITIDKKIML